MPVEESLSAANFFLALFLEETAALKEFGFSFSDDLSFLRAIYPADTVAVCATSSLVLRTIKSLF